MIQRKYISGKLNTDDSPYTLPQGDYMDGWNLSVDPAKGIVGSLRSNRQVSSYTLPAGRNKVIGRKDDITRKRIIYFVWNENGNHCIMQYFTETGINEAIVVNKTYSGGFDLFQWTETSFITSIGIIHRDIEGDILYWCLPDREPNAFIIDKVKSQSYGMLNSGIISAGKRPPLDCPKVNYADDVDRNVNSLRKKLYQFTYRYVYDTFEKSTWSPYSVVPLPNNVIGTDADMDGTKNNYINIAYNTGPINVIAVEIAVRECVGAAWSDLLQVVYINKSQYQLSNNSIQYFRFYNDGQLPVLDVRESLLSFDWFPRFADCMEIVNGNTVVYGGITEGYNPINKSTLNVKLSSRLVANNGVDPGPTKLVYEQESGQNGGSGVFKFTLSGNIIAGTTLQVIAQIGGELGSTILSLYVTKVGDTIQSAVNGLFESTNDQYAGVLAPTFYQVYLPVNSSIFQINIVNGAGAGDSGASTSVTPWNWYSRYKFGLVYFDAMGRTCGVETKYSLSDNDYDFEVETDGVELSSALLKTPTIDAEIYHLPPAHAKSFCWVRSKNLAFDKYLYYGTHDFQQDADYFYFGLDNISYFKGLNDRFIYNSISDIVAPSDRIRILTQWNVAGGYGSVVYNEDYEIVGVVERQVTDGTATDLGKFVKVQKPKLNAPTDYVANMMVMVYSPAKQASADSLVYFEFGETYPITNGYHTGNVQNQDAGAVPAKFTFNNGDVYFRPRTLYKTTLVAPANKGDLMMMDANYSDYFSSAVTSDGRPWAEDINARQTYNPAMTRFSQMYESGTNINGLCRFYFDNFQEYDRAYGAIRRMRMRDRQLRVFQQYKVGAVPVYTQIIKDAGGGSQLAQSDRLLNDIQYYAGEFGIGDATESLASNNFADYFIDNNRGVLCRLSIDGLTPISITTKFNTYAQAEFVQRGKGKAFGAFDPEFNRYFCVLLATDNSSAHSFYFNEVKNGLESKSGYAPEMFASVGSNLYSFVDGELYAHDEDTTKLMFCGETYTPSIKVAFNENPQIKKDFLSVSVHANNPWEFANIETSTEQESELRHSDFRSKNGVWHSSLLRDRKSPKGLINGDKLQGVYMTATLSPRIGNQVQEMFLVELRYNVKNLNNR